MDGHSSHITANYCKRDCFLHEKPNWLLILPLHCLHLLQPLDFGVFAPLKRALASQTNAALRLDSGRVSRVEWSETYICASSRALTTNSFLGGWRGAGLMPLSPIEVFGKLPTESTTAT